MTDITINLKDFITIGFFLVAAIGLWFKVRKIQLNDLDDIKKELTAFKLKYTEEMATLQTCVKELKKDIDKHLNQK